MTSKKTHLGNLPMVYAVVIYRREDVCHFLAATELYGQWLQFSPPDYRPQVVSHRPGGVMGFAPHPRGGGLHFAIEQAYPIYNFSEAKISLVSPGGRAGELWNKQPVASVPFVHRIGVLPTGDDSFLAAGIMCGAKDHQEDWSRPGAVQVASLKQFEATGKLSWVRVFEGLARNHGMHITAFQGRPTLFVSGIEGVFALNPVRRGTETWQSQHLLNHDVSDLTVFDLDGDGVEEMVTIEPFHGDTVRVYRQHQGKWESAIQLPAAFGHVVWAGFIRGRRCLLLGNRAGRKDLRLLVFRGEGSLEFEELLLDENVGPANVAVAHEHDRDLILSANHVRGEVALYEIR